MSKTCVIDCAIGTVVIRDMTAAEEAQWQKDLVSARTAMTDSAAVNAQRSVDLTTVGSGPTAPGYSDALVRLLRR